MAGLAEKGGESIEVNSFIDLTPLDNLERRITDLLKKNRDLKSEVGELKRQIQQQEEELQRLSEANADQVQGSLSFEKADQIRNKISLLLDKLENY